MKRVKLRRIIKRQLMMVGLYQHLDLGASQNDALGPARGQVIDDVQIEVARPVPDLTATQLFKDDPVDGGNLRLFRQQRLDPEPGPTALRRNPRPW